MLKKIKLKKPKEMKKHYLTLMFTNLGQGLEACVKIDSILPSAVSAQTHDIKGNQ